MRVPGQAYRVQLVLGDDGPRPTTESREAIIGSPNPKKSPILYKMQSNSARWPKPTRAARLQRPRTKRARMCTLARKVSTVQPGSRKMAKTFANVQLPCPKRARMCTFAREVSKRRLIRAFRLHIRAQSVQISPIHLRGGQNRREIAHWRSKRPDFPDSSAQSPEDLWAQEIGVVAPCFPKMRLRNLRSGSFGR